MATGGTLAQFGIVVVAVLGLWIGARLLVDSAVRLARRIGLSDLTIGLTVVAVGTSTPELVVTADATLKGLGDIAVGNVLGSNIYNLAFILGVVALLKVIPITASLVRRDGAVLVASTLLGGAILFDRTVTRPEGVVLVGLLVAYTAYLLRTDEGVDGAAAGDTDGSGDEREDGDGNTDGDDDESTRTAVTRPITERFEFPGRDPLLLLLGLAVVLVSGDALVLAASTLARGAGISEWVIGGTIVAAGTSTPEFAVSLVAVRRGSLGVSVGNVIGSNVFNLLGVMGIAAVVRPLVVSATALTTLAWLLGISIVMVAALWSGRKLSRIEGAAFAGSEVVRWLLGLFG